MTSEPDSGTILDAILGHARKRPTQPALTIGVDVLDWHTLAERILEFGGMLKSKGVVAGDRIAILSGNSTDAVVAFLGAVAAGAVAVPLPGSSTPTSLAILLANCDPTLLVVGSGATVLGSLSDDIKTIPLDGHAGSKPLAQCVVVDEQSPFNIIYSSGTTGTPKGIVHSHAMRNRQAGRGVFDIDEGSVMLLATALYSNTTLMPMLSGLSHGAHVVVMGKFDAAGYLELAQKHCATHTMLVPVQYQRILALDGFDEYDLRSFKVKQCTSAPMDAGLKRDILIRWPGRFLEIYGLTEGGVTAILDASAHGDKLETVGRPAPGNDLRIIDEDGRLLQQGEIGEIIGRSSFMMLEYWRRQDITEAFYWRNEQGDVYHRSGDLGAFDEDGFLTIQGRKKDVIISGGSNIYPSDLEAVVLAHEDVLEVAVVGVPSKDWGETPLAFVVARDRCALGAADIIDWANARLGRMQRISEVKFIDALPRSAIGKILKQKLRDPYWARQAGGENDK